MAKHLPKFDPELLDALLAGADPKTVLSSKGLFGELKKALAERMLQAELDHHLDRPEEEASGNHRNGTSAKTVLADDEKLDLRIPRDRHGRFEPALIAKYERRLPGFDAKVIAMYARGMTTREIRATLLELYGLEVSPELISTITDAVLEEVTQWQSRPLEPVYISDSALP
jgi:putative transposase